MDTLTVQSLISGIAMFPHHDACSGEAPHHPVPPQDQYVPHLHWQGQPGLFQPLTVAQPDGYVAQGSASGTDIAPAPHHALNMPSDVGQPAQFHQNMFAVEPHGSQMQCGSQPSLAFFQPLTVAQPDGYFAQDAASGTDIAPAPHHALNMPSGVGQPAQVHQNMFAVEVSSLPHDSHVHCGSQPVLLGAQPDVQFGCLTQPILPAQHYVPHMHWQSDVNQPDHHMHVEQVQFGGSQPMLPSNHAQHDTHFGCHDAQMLLGGSQPMLPSNHAQHDAHFDCHDVQMLLGGEPTNASLQPCRA